LLCTSLPASCILPHACCVNRHCGRLRVLSSCSVYYFGLAVAAGQECLHRPCRGADADPRLLRAILSLVQLCGHRDGAHHGHGAADLQRHHILRREPHNRHLCGGGYLPSAGVCGLGHLHRGRDPAGHATRELQWCCVQCECTVCGHSLHRFVFARAFLPNSCMF
jgi:hypothetical protein